MTIAYRRRAPGYTVTEVARITPTSILPLTPPPLFRRYPVEGEIAVIDGAPLTRAATDEQQDQVLLILLIWLLWRNRAAIELILSLLYLLA